MELTQRQHVLDDTFLKLAKVTSSLLFGDYDTDVEQEVTALIDAEMVIRTAMTQNGDEMRITVGQLRDKWLAVYRTTPSAIYEQGLEYIETCLSELTEVVE